MGVKNWKAAGQVREADVNRIQQKYSLPRPIALFCVIRGIDENEIPNFFQPKLGNLSDPYRFPKIQDAAKRLWDAILNRESILIHGDYDTDGITASALLSLVLRQNGAIVHSFIPHRFDDGYGFTPESLEKALAAFGKCNVLVTVDCGVTSCDAVKVAINQGIDVIVTDHHEAAAELPEALAIINPRVYPELDDLQILSGAGTAFKLSHAFIKYGREHNLGGFQTRLEDVLDFVALGTVADIVPLLGENRILVKAGIDVLRKQLRPGVRALIESCHLKNDMTPSDITFKLAPRINAAGRVGNGNVALNLLESENIVDAYRFAGTLENFNKIRQDKEQEIYQEAKEQIERNLAWQSDYLLLVAGRDWHQGVIGIVASRLARDYNRPTIVLTIQGDHAYGSGRSVACLNLVDILSKTSHLLERYGGHPMAVGVGLRTDRIADFFEAMDKEVRSHISVDELENFQSFDGEVALKELDSEFFRYLNLLAPFGHSNSKPVFRFNELTLQRCYMVGGKHSRGILCDKTHHMDFIAFNTNMSSYTGQLLDVLATPQLNSHYNHEMPQLNIVDFKPSY